MAIQRRNRSRDEFAAGGWFPRSAPRPVEGGIHAKGRFGRTWWAKRWVEALSAFEGSRRLARVRSYARKGQIVRYAIRSGYATALVQGTHPGP